MAKILRIVRVVTTVTDVDLTSYFDLVPHLDGSTIKRPWTLEEAIAYERNRGQQDKHEAFEVALEAGEMTGFVQAYDIIDTSVAAAISDEAIADEQGATYLTPSRDTEQAGYEENARVGLLGT